MLSVGSQHYRKFLTLSSYSLSPNGPVQCVPTLGLPWGTWILNCNLLQFSTHCFGSSSFSGVPLSLIVADSPMSMQLHHLTLYTFLAIISPSQCRINIQQWRDEGCHCLPSSVREEYPRWPAAETPRGEVSIHKHTPGCVWCCDVMVAWTNVIIRFASALVILSATRFSQQLKTLGLKH